MNAERSTREGILLKLLEEFRNHGFEGVSLSRISQVTGLGKASLYHYFPGGKSAMAEAVMGFAGEWLETHVFGPLEADGAPVERLEAVLQALASFYQDGRKPCLLDVMPIGGGPQVQAAVTATFQRLLAGFQRLAMAAGHSALEAEARAEGALVAIQGSLVLARGLRNPAPFTHQMHGLRARFLA